MRIQRVRISNFRNFQHIDVVLDENAVILGENKIGKSNFLYALRLVLDPSLPDSARQLQRTDFWDGLGDTPSRDDQIEISVDLTDFDDDEDLLAVLAEHLIQPEPMISRISFVFRCKTTPKDKPTANVEHEFLTYGGDREENRVGYEVRSGLPLDILPALRDAEGDLLAWQRSPLKPLLERAAQAISPEDLHDIADQVLDATKVVTDRVEITALAEMIVTRMTDMVGSGQSLEAVLGFSPTDPDRLIRSIRLFIDGGRRSIGDASLGSANLLYLVLKSLELEQLVTDGHRHHTFLGIEEPEAHLHPHLQRLAYRDFLQPRAHQQQPNGDEPPKRIHQTILLTTHSPHVASVAPLRSIVLLKRIPGQACTTAVSTAKIDLSDQEVIDLERYLDVTRGELLFARGVLLVEGDAETYVVPTLGRIMGHDFDELGISVCSVSGTNFLPYVKVLGTNGLGIPFAVITDFDLCKDGSNLGEKRVWKLLECCRGKPVSPKMPNKVRLRLAERQGLFLGQHTLEIDLFQAGYGKQMCDTLEELTDNNAAKSRAQKWRKNPKTLEQERFLSDIEHIGKGRFAQRLATTIRQDHCPTYIRKAVEYVVDKCS